MRSIRVVILAVPLLVHQRLAKKGRLPDIRTTSNKKKLNFELSFGSSCQDVCPDNLSSKYQPHEPIKQTRKLKMTNQTITLSRGG